MIDKFLKLLTTDKFNSELSNFLQTTNNMLIDILNDYNIPSRDYLFSHSSYPEVRAFVKAVNNTTKPTTGSTNAGGDAPQTKPDKENEQPNWNNRQPQKQSADWGSAELDNAINSWF
jgi:hypothetical protein